MTYQRNETVKLEEPLKGLELGKRLVDCDLFFRHPESWSGYIQSPRTIEDMANNPKLPLLGDICYRETEADGRHAVQNFHGIMGDFPVHIARLSVSINGDGNLNDGYASFTIKAIEQDPRSLYRSRRLKTADDEKLVREQMDNHINMLIEILRGKK